MKIISSEIQDALVLTNLINAAYKHEKEWKTSPRTDIDSVMAMINSEVMDLYKGMDNDDIICCASLEYHEDWAMFGLLSVWPWIQGKGHGYEMIRFLEDMARIQGCSTMRCEVASFNTHLMEYYEKMGYVHFDSKPWKEPSLKIDNVTFELYQKQL